MKKKKGFVVMSFKKSPVPYDCFQLYKAVSTAPTVPLYELPGVIISLGLMSQKYLYSNHFLSSIPKYLEPFPHQKLGPFRHENSNHFHLLIQFRDVAFLELFDLCEVPYVWEIYVQIIIHKGYYSKELRFA